MVDGEEGCKGESGCIRDHDWPDLPSTSVLNCEGQCRDGAAGRGPTNPRWLAQYCEVTGHFYTGLEFEEQFHSLCRSKMVQSSDGITVEGRSHKWSSEPVSDEEFEANWAAYTTALKATLPFYMSDKLQSSDINSLEDKFKKVIEHNGQSIEVTNTNRWKGILPTSLYSPILGPTAFRDIPSILNFPHKSPSNFKESAREFHGPGQPACGVLGDRSYIGSGKFARLMSLSNSNADSTLWELEDGSEFPFLHKKSTGEECLLINTNGSRDKFPNYRQNFGTVVTSQGLWMIGGLVAPSADLAGRALNKKYNVDGCTNNAHMNDVWVFNPKGWSLEDILSNDSALIAKYSGNFGDIIPKKTGYTFGKAQSDRIAVQLDQTLSDFRLSDVKGGDFDLTIDSALEEGWACTGVQGKWCRKPFLPRETKGAESVIMCFEPSSGTENYGYVRFGENKQIQRRPKACMINDTDGSKDEKCICYIVNVSGQSGIKQAEGGSGFRPEIDYLEIPRADGKYGSDHPDFAREVAEYCPDAEATFPGIDQPINHDGQSAVSAYTECTEECGGSGQPACNRLWKAKNLRRRWHEAGKIKHPRMGFLAGTLMGEVVVWGGECYGPSSIRQWNLDGSLRSTRVNYQPRACGITIDSNSRANNDDYMEIFSMIRMNSAGYLFGERRYVELEGYLPGRAAHGEAAVSQSYSMFNTLH